MRLFNVRAAIGAAALYSVLQSTTFLGNFATFDAASVFLLAVSAWAVVRTGRMRAHAVLLAAPPAALAFGVKYAAGLFLPTLVVLAVLTAYRHRGVRALGRGVVLGLGILAVLGAGLLALRAARRHQRHHDRPCQGHGLRVHADRAQRGMGRDRLPHGAGRVRRLRLAGADGRDAVDGRTDPRPLAARRTRHAAHRHRPARARLPDPPARRDLPQQARRVRSPLRRADGQASA